MERFKQGLAMGHGDSHTTVRLCFMPFSLWLSKWLKPYVCILSTPKAVKTKQDLMQGRAGEKKWKKKTQYKKLSTPGLYVHGSYIWIKQYTDENCPETYIYSETCPVPPLPSFQLQADRWGLDRTGLRHYGGFEIVGRRE